MPIIKKTKVEFEGQIQEVEAIVEEERVSPWGPDADLKIVGKPTPRVDGVARVTGQALYTHDVQLPGMLTGVFLRSPYPHAMVKAVDSSRAEALPGVWLAWHRFQPPPIEAIYGTEMFPEELTKQGDEVAFLVADNERIAQDALALIAVEYEELPFVHDLASATAEGAPPVFAADGSNAVDPEGRTYSRGDVEHGFAEADVVIENTCTTPMLSHCCLETHGSVVQWEGDHLTAWHSTQRVFDARSSLAEALNIPQDKVRVICDYVGGGFGSKGDAEEYTVLAALAARATNRPVKALLRRDEEHLVAGYRPSSKQTVRVGAKRDGTLTAIEHHAWIVTGDYGGEGNIVEGPSRDLYACPNVSTAIWSVRANYDRGRAMRAPGYVEGTFALESALDVLAKALEMDPLDLRLKNYAAQSPQRNIPYTYKGLRDAYELAAGRFDWASREARRASAAPWRRGFGMASQIWGGGGGPPANAIVKMLPDGTAEVLAGVQDLGTGTRTVIAQVAAEELGLPLTEVRAIIGDTQATPFGPGSGGSVTLASITPAVRSAARDAVSQLAGLAAYMLGVPDAGPDDLHIALGEITYRQDQTKRISYGEVAAKMGDYMIVGRGARGPNPDRKALNTFGAQFAEVEVNTETGQVRVVNITAAHSIGRVINPLTAASQVHGGAIMGLGSAISEGRVIDAATGLQLTTNLEDYRPPTIMDVPPIAAEFPNVPDPQANSVGALGLGEPPVIPTLAAIANAVADAIGVRISDSPITPDRVLAALQNGKEAA